jgi:hypothetical protein
MLPGLRESRRLLGLAMAAWCGLAASLAAQAPQEGKGPVWTVVGLRTGQCVRFLLDPGIARRVLHEDARLIPANRDEKLYPALRNVIQSQPDFATWVASSLCLYYGDALTLSGRRFGGKDPRKSQMIGLWSAAASEQGTGARRDVVLDFFGVGGGLAQAARYGKVKLNEVQSSVSKVPGSGNDLYQVKIGKTRLVWNGRPAGDSTRVDQPITESWLAKGTSGTLWKVSTTLRPEWSRPLVGVLSVEGKDDLAKALKASPIRFVGPLYQGGGGELRFSR